MNDYGVLFYVDKDKPLKELVPCLWSFKNTNPNIPHHVIVGPSTPKWFVRELQEYSEREDLFTISRQIQYKLFNTYKNRKLSANLIAKRRSWWQKYLCLQDAPFDITLYMDCDHIFFQEIPADYFKQIEKHGLVSGYSRRRLRRTSMYESYAKAFTRWGKEIAERFVIPDRDTFSRVCGGCIGVNKNHPRYFETIRPSTFFWTLGDLNVQLAGDEVALSFGCNILGDENCWFGNLLSLSARPKRKMPFQTMPQNAVSFHFSREQWKQPDLRREIFMWHLRCCVEDDFLAMGSKFSKYVDSSKALQEILPQESWMLSCLQ